MRFDGPTFARAWLAVAQASATDPDLYHLYRSVFVEEYAEGVRLVATDGRMLLVAWVPDLDHTDNEDPGDADPPGLDVLPLYTAKLRDIDHRGQSLVKYAVKLLAGFEKDIRRRVGLVKLDVHFDIERPETPDGDVVLDGMDYRYSALEIPDAERVYLERLDEATPFPDWRKALTHDEAPTADLRLNPELLGRAAAAGAHARGPVLLTFTGDRSAIKLDYESPRPIVSGVLLPMRDPYEDDKPREACNACDDPDRLCLRHASGVVTKDDPPT